jgi:hypothetical protein
LNITNHVKFHIKHNLIFSVNVLFYSKLDKFENFDELNGRFSFKINNLKSIESKLWIINIDKLKKLTNGEISPFINREYEEMISNNTNFYQT